MKNFTRKVAPAALVAAFLAAFGPATKAQTISGSELADIGDFGTLAQNNAGITFTNTLNVAPQACVPTSVVNGLIFLENLNDIDPFENYNPASSYANASEADNDLATAMGTYNVPVQLANGNIADVGGTSYGTTGPYTDANGDQTTTVTGMVPGLADYIGAGGANPAPDISIVGGQYAPTGVANNQIPAGWIGALPADPDLQNAIPTINFLASELDQDAAVEIGIQWGVYVNGQFGNYNANGVFVAGLNAGGHAVTLDSIGLNLLTGTGTFGLLDSDDGASTAVQENGTLSLTGGYLYLSYPTTTSDLNYPGQPTPGNLDSIAGAGQTGRIVIDLAENVPDGGVTAVMLAGAFLGLAGLGLAGQRVSRASL